MISCFTYHKTGMIKKKNMKKIREKADNLRAGRCKLPFSGGHWCCEKKMPVVNERVCIFRKGLNMQSIIQKVHVHMPYHLLPRYLPMILEHRLNLELYFNHHTLSSIDRDDCLRTAELLKDGGLKFTFHAPFVDLRPGALDDRIRKASMERIRQAFDLAQYFQPLKIVCHPSYDDRYYVNCDDLWLENSVRFWSELKGVAKDAGAAVALENVYEKEPDILRKLMEILVDDHFCFCFDTGHFNVFSNKSLQTWIEQMGAYIGHLHLHDNFGEFDEHLPVGTATFPFRELFTSLGELGVRPTVTLEAHRQDHLWQSLDNLQKMSLLDLLG